MGTHYEQLTPEERATIMVMRSQHCSARHIARTLHLSASTIADELKRFTAWQDRPAFVLAPQCAYDARAAGLWARRQRFKPRRCSNLAVDTVLFGVVQHFLTERWSPSQIAGTLKRMWPDDSQRTVSHETIYNCIYAVPRGELRKDLIACLRWAQSKRIPRSRGEGRRGQLPEVLRIHDLAIAVSGLLHIEPFPLEKILLPATTLYRDDYHLIKGAGNRSTVGVLVERSSRFVMPAKLAAATAASALEGFTAKLRSIADPMRQTLTYVSDP